MRKSTFWGVKLLVCISVWGAANVLNERLYGQEQALDKIAPKSVAALRSTVLFFGENVRFAADIAAEAHIPAQELTVFYQFSGDERIEAPYQAPFTGERIPGYARKVEVEFYRGSGNAEKQLLWAHTFDVQQIPPTFNIAKASAETVSGKGKSIKPGECTFVVKGLRVDFAKPVDTDKNRVVTALVDDLEIADDPVLDAVKTSVQFFNGEKADEKMNSVLKAEMMSVSSFFDAGVFLVTVSIKNLPKIALKGKTLRGTIGIKLSVKLLNRRAMRSATATETVIVPIALLF